MKKKLIIILSCFLVIIIICGIFFYYKSPNTYQSNGSSHIVASIDDDITADTMRCGTFQLVWNDMIDKIVKQDIIFSPQTKAAENLNKQSFTLNQLSPNGYFIKSGLFTKALKKEIENGIKEKFNETSNILDAIDRNSAPEDDDSYTNSRSKEYLFYAMLKKVFNFKQKFDVLNKGKFDNKYQNIEYFGIKKGSSSSLYQQVSVLYYNSKNDFAVSLTTNEGENIVLERGTNKPTFNEIYKTVTKKSDNFKGDKSFGSHDYLKVPKIKLNTQTSYEELKNKSFHTADGYECAISEAIQTIEFDLDEKGGKIKSEALALATKGDISISFSKEPEPRYFYFDKPFVIFLIEKDKELPYFAAQISDITLFQ